MIVVTTPTGQIGSQVVDHLLAGAEPVRVIVRDPARLAPHVRDRVEVVTGTHRDPGVVRAAYQGADAVFWLVPPVPTVTDLPAHFLSFTRPTRDAVAEHGVGHVVGVSTLGRGVARNAGHISHTLAMDELIEETGVHYRALCMPGFMENVLRQVVPIRDHGVYYDPLDGDARNPTCAVRDIAAVAAGLLTDRSWTGQEDLAVRGPEELSPRELAATMAEVLGRPVRLERITLADYQAAIRHAGGTAEWAQGLADMTEEVAGGLYHAETAMTAAKTPTTFRQWCEEVLRPAVSG